VTESSVLLLPFTASSVGVARRRLVSDLIAVDACDSAICDAALVLSELLSNALRHAVPLPGAKISVAWRLDTDSVQLSVRDGGGKTQPELGEPTQATTGGRGLRIVEKLSRCWGTSSDEDGTTVWAQVPFRRTAEMTSVGAPAAAAEGGLRPGGPRYQGRGNYAPRGEWWRGFTGWTARSAGSGRLSRTGREPS
jgi:anti-sigma regulatory factor (Ser/Thr protein kinase)